jgi:hypothetical protein
VAVAAVANQLLLILAVPVAVVAETVVHPHQQVQAVHQDKVTQAAQLLPARMQVVAVAAGKVLLVLAAAAEVLQQNLVAQVVLALNGLMELSMQAVAAAVQNLVLAVVGRQAETAAAVLAAKVTHKLQLLVLLIEVVEVEVLAAVAGIPVLAVRVLSLFVMSVRNAALVVR